MHFGMPAFGRVDDATAVLAAPGIPKRNEMKSVRNAHTANANKKTRNKSSANGANQQAVCVYVVVRQQSYPMVRSFCVRCCAGYSRWHFCDSQNVACRANSLKWFSRCGYLRVILQLTARATKSHGTRLCKLRASGGAACESAYARRVRQRLETNAHCTPLAVAAGFASAGVARRRTPAPSIPFAATHRQT